MCQLEGECKRRPMHCMDGSWGRVACAQRFAHALVRLHSQGVNIMAFCKEYNAQTAKMAGQVIPVEITVYEVRSRPRLHVTGRGKR